MEEYAREPCPFRIGDDIGGAFAMGAIGGSIFHSFFGFRNAAKGQKLASMFREVRMRSPVTGGQFAAWGGMFSTIDCCMAYVRQKEDPFNSVISGGLTGALLTVRSGPRNMLISGAVGAFLLGMIEGMGVLMTRWTAPAYDPTMQAIDMPDPQNLPPKKESSPVTENTPFGLPSHMSMSS